MQSIGSKGRKGDPMNKRIPVNPKYQHVKSTIDTGKSLSKYMERIENIRENYKFRQNEIFKRMKVTTFAQLAVQVSRVNSMEMDDNFSYAADTDRPDSVDRELQMVEEKARGDQGQSPVPSLAVTEGDYGREASVAGSISERSTLQSVTRGVGELDMNKPPPAPENRFVNNLSPYLLLDVRDKDDFERCHIITACSYPKAELSKAQNYESKAMLEYKNKPGKIIVIYDEDERIAPNCAQTLVQRGYDNLFMLSGGLKVAYKLIPEGFLTGTPPPTLLASKPKTIVPATKTEFSMEDINLVDDYIDKSLQDHSTAGSRMSTTSSRQSVASARSTLSSASSKPWK